MIQAQEDLRQEVLQLRARVRTLEDELTAERLRSESLEVELVSATEDLQRYRQGLGRAVDELNRQSRRPARTPRSPSAGGSSRPTASTVRAYGGPDVQIFGDMVQVTGRLWNSGDQTLDVTVEVDLLLNGQVVGSRSLSRRVGGGTEAPYSTSFPARGGEGTFSAQIRVR